MLLLEKGPMCLHFHKTSHNTTHFAQIDSLIVCLNMTSNTKLSALLFSFILQLYTLIASSHLSLFSTSDFLAETSQTKLTLKKMESSIKSSVQRKSNPGAIKLQVCMRECWPCTECVSGKRLETVMAPHRHRLNKDKLRFSHQ